MERASDKLGAPRVTPEQWEQRRYEIARDILAASYVTNDALGLRYSDMAYDAVQCADELIKELKQKRQ